MAIIYLSSPLARRVNLSSVEINADSLGTCLEQLVKTYPDIKNYIFSEARLVAPFTKIFVNQIDSNSLTGLNTQVTPDDEIQIIVAISGG